MERQRRQGPDTWFPYSLGGLKVASWIFVALLLAGVTGLSAKFERAQCTG
jgi:hypothetical protein